MKFQFIQEPHKKQKGLRTVEMDEGIIYLKEDLGFNTYGVASCIVFVAYYHNKPLFMLHWSTPDSKARLSKVNQNVICLLQALEDSLSMHEIDLNMVTVYALGGQESSYHTITSLVVQSMLKTNAFKLNVDFLNVTHYEDCFDLFVLPGSETFYAVHHPTPVTMQEIVMADENMTKPIDILKLYCAEKYRKMERSKEKHRKFSENDKNAVYKR